MTKAAFAVVGPVDAFPFVVRGSVGSSPSAGSNLQTRGVRGNFICLNEWRLPPLGASSGGRPDARALDETSMVDSEEPLELRIVRITEASVLRVSAALKPLRANSEIEIALQ
jgi:hypothetical protein